MSSKTTVQVLQGHIDDLGKLRKEYTEKSKLLMDQQEEFQFLITALQKQLDQELDYKPSS